MTRRELNGQSVVDLDRQPVPSKAHHTAAPRRRPRRQCAYCLTNRGAIFQWALKGSEVRALEALRRAHPDEYDELLQRERDTAEASAAKSWELHLENRCSRASRIAGTATNHHHSGR